MSWINSNATYKQNSKNDLSFYHGFSKTPVEPTSTGTAATTLANASTKGGHTVIGTEVWAEEIPWFGLVPSRAVAVTRLSGLTKLNDLVKVDGEGGKVYKYIGADDATFTEDTWADFWQEVTLTNGMELNNRHNQPVLRYYLNQPMQTLTTVNNASIDSKGYATRLFVNEENHTGQTSGGSVVSQFAAGTDNIKNGIPSVELNPKLYLGTTEKIAGTHYYDYNVSGTILWSTAVTSSSPKISCFRYIGKTVTGQLSTVDTTVKSHTLDIADIKLALGMDPNPNPDSPTTSVTSRVETVEDVVRTLLGISSDATITATDSIATTAANAISTSLAGTTEGTIGKAIADAKQEALDAINAIQHFSVEIVPEGQTIESITPVENTIYLVSDSQAADGSYIEYIAFKQGETIVTEKIGSTKLDLSGYTTDAEHEALQNRVSTAEGQIATITSTDTTKEGSIAKALADAKTYAEGQASAAKSDAVAMAANALSAARTEITAEIAQAKSEAIASAEVTITAGTGIVVTGEGKGTTFQIAVSDDVATAAALSALSQTVASNKTELEGKITVAETAASAALETAKTEIKGTTDALDTRLQTAEGKITALTEGESSVDSKIAAAQTALQGNIDGVSARVTELETVTVPAAAKAAQDAMAEAQAKVASVSGPTTGLVSVTGDKEITITVSDTIATKDYADTAASTAITTGLAEGGSITQAIATAKSEAEQTAATALSTARGEITTEISTAVSGLETKLTTGEGSLGAKVAALETATDTTLPAAIEQALQDAKAYSDSLHTTSLDYVVLGDSESLPTASADTLGKIYLVASQNAPAADGSAISGSYVEYMTRKVSETEYTWEKIGTTAADLSAYAKTADLNATNVGSGAVKVSQTNGVVSSVTVDTEALVSNNAIKESTTSETALITAKDALEAIKLAKPDNYVASVTGYDTWGGEVTTTQGATVKVLDGRGTSVTDKDLWGTTATMDADGVITLAHNWVTNPNASGGAWNSSITRVEDNKAYIGDTFHANIQTERIKNSNDMFAGCSNLTSFSSDLSSLMDGEAMFSWCTKLSTFEGDLSSLTNGTYMFHYCSKLVSFSSDSSGSPVNLSNLTIGKDMFHECDGLTSFNSNLSNLMDGEAMFYGCDNLISFTSDLSSLRNGERMFSDCFNLTSFTADLSNLTNGENMFQDCSILKSFSSDLSNLKYGYNMFHDTSLESFSSDLSNLTNGHLMFSYCYHLKSFSSDLSNLTDGRNMFYSTSLASFVGDLSSLTNGASMFESCDELESFVGDLSSLTNGEYMFVGCAALTSFTSDLSSLTNGTYMFHGCQLDTDSVECIADTINTISNGRIDIYISNLIPSAEEHAAFTMIHSKGWNVYVNSSNVPYVPAEGEATLDETGESTVAPKPYWAKPIEVAEEKAEFVGEDGKFYQVVGGQFIYVSDPDTYGMFTSREDAIANMRLTKYEKPAEEAETPAEEA